jgi:hypothetical protein
VSAVRWFVRDFIGWAGLVILVMVLGGALIAHAIAGPIAASWFCALVSLAGAGVSVYFAVRA